MAATIVSDEVNKSANGRTTRTIRIQWDENTTVANAEEELTDFPPTAELSCVVLESEVTGAAGASTVQPLLSWLTGVAAGFGFLCQVAAAADYVRPVGVADQIGAMPLFAPAGSIFVNPVPDADLAAGQTIEMLAVFAWD